ncbi:YebC/PmpR family DNA-binding transcriptional regulator [Malacoplasma muris]|uniref:YebC/PmpR family DNA-binding transcriptional regulator n=1 Tax=Malacoplasma muris TaxID=2119 RepID=UPI00398EA088
MPRKHLIASGINKKQQSQAKIWNKLAKEIKAAAKVGGTNPEANPRLKAAIDKALQNNLSRDSIDRNINGATKDKDNQTDYLFEIYGPKGLAIIVMGLTDNQNRLLSSLKGYLSKLKADIATPNSVKMNFKYCGEIIIPLNKLEDQEKKEEANNYELIILEKCMELGIDDIDIIINDDCLQVLTTPKDFYVVRDKLNESNLTLVNSEVRYIPNDYINLDNENYEKLTRFLDSCEEDDDIQWVVTNFGEVI